MRNVKTLFLVDKPIAPPVGGAALRNRQNIQALQTYGPVEIFCLTDAEVAEVDDSGLKITYARPSPDTSSLQKITRQIKILGWLLSHHGPLTDTFYNPESANTLETLLERFRPDLVIFEEIWLYSYLSIVQRYPCKIILDAHNSETELFHQIYSIQPLGLAQKIGNFLRLSLIQQIEEKLLFAASQLWACSSNDLQLLNKNNLVNSTFVIPNGVDVNYYGNTGNSEHSLPEKITQNPHNIVFTASFSYAPNSFAAQVLLNEIFPKIRDQYPNCNLLLVGSEPTHEMLELAKQSDNIIVTGRVPDIRPYLAAASIVVVPLFQGSGTRLKILEAFAARRLVISTSLGAEGLAVEDGEQLLIRDTAEAIVEAIQAVWESPNEHFTPLIDSAYNLVKSKYSWQASAKIIKTAVHELFASSKIDS